MNKNRTEIIFLLDRRGSMSGLKEDTIGGFNAFINQQNKLLSKDGDHNCSGDAVEKMFIMIIVNLIR